MLRKPTRPTMVCMPRRDPTQQLCAKQPNSILRRPSQQRPGNRPSSAPRKRVRFTELPQRLIVSSYAADPHSILREILSEKHGSEADKMYKLHASTVLPPANTAKTEDGLRIPVIGPSERSRGRHTWSTVFPGVKGHRFWKLKPGHYRLVDSRPNGQRIEVVLGCGKALVRTTLPLGVAEPPEKAGDTFLEIEASGDGQWCKRVTAKWVSV